MKNPNLYSCESFDRKYHFIPVKRSWDFLLLSQELTQFYESFFFVRCQNLTKTHWDPRSIVIWFLYVTVWCFPQLLAFVHTCYVISTFSDEDDGCEYSWSRVHTEIRRRHGITHNSSASFELFCFLLFYTCPCICSVQVVVWTQLCSFSSSSSSPFLVVNFIGDFHHPSKPHFFF